MTLKTGELIELIGYWFDDTGLTEKGTLEAQNKKTVEEDAELQQAIGSGDRAKIIDELGDRFVTAVGMCKQLEVGVEEVLYLVYHKIAARLEEGKLVNSTFVKKEDL